MICATCQISILNRRSNAKYCSRKCAKRADYQRNKSQRNSYSKRYHAENKEEVSKRAAEYFQENKESIYAYKRKWNEENKDKMTSYFRNYRYENAYAINARARKIYQERIKEKRMLSRERSKRHYHATKELNYLRNRLKRIENMDRERELARIRWEKMPWQKKYRKSRNYHPSTIR